MMKYMISLLLLAGSLNAQMIYNFHNEADVSDWRVVDDVVMGGRSDGSFSLNDDGFGVFKGYVSLENNGGFSSIRYPLETMSTKGRSEIILKVKGDGKRYQFRVKDKQSTYYSYIHYFETSGDWEEITIPLKEMNPSFRGRKLNFPNFNEDSIEEISILIANYKAESFELLIDEISLK